MSKIDLGAKLIADPSKADPNLRYDFTPDIVVTTKEGKVVNNIDLGDEAIVLEKKYFTAGDKARLNMRFGSDGSISLPMIDAWKMSVVGIRGLDIDNRPARPDEIINAVGSPLADNLIVANYNDSMRFATLTEDERKN